MAITFAFQTCRSAVATTQVHPMKGVMLQSKTLLQETLGYHVEDPDCCTACYPDSRRFDGNHERRLRQTHGRPDSLRASWLGPRLGPWVGPRVRPPVWRSSRDWRRELPSADSVRIRPRPL